MTYSTTQLSVARFNLENEISRQESCVAGGTSGINVLDVLKTGQVGRRHEVQQSVAKRQLAYANRHGDYRQGSNQSN